jgi:DNA-binding transcriptional MerR regulator
MALASRKPDLDQPAIPDRLYFKIGDVAKICDLETYVLRFWETQFPQLKPNKSGTGQRLYRRRDVELVLDIKRLVHAEGYTISGARHALEQDRRPKLQSEPQTKAQPNPQSNLGVLFPLASSDAAKRQDALAATIGQARAELRSLAALLSAPVAAPPRRRARITPLPTPSGFLFPS